MKVNFRQFSVMCFYLLISLKFLALPSLVYNGCQSDSWIVFVCMGIVDISLVWVSVYLIKSSNEKNFYEFLKHRFGTVVAKIICFVFLLVFMLDILDGVIGIFRLLVEEFYTNIKWYNYIIPLLCLLAFMVYKGSRNIARVCEMFVWIIIVGLVFVVLKSFSEFDIFFFLPSMTKGVSPIFSTLFKHMSWFGTPVALLFLLGEVDMSKLKKGVIWRYLLIATLIVVVLVCVFYGVFKDTAGMHSFALTDLSQVSNESTAIDEISWFAVIIWVMAQILSLAIVMLSATKAFKYVFSIKQDWIPILILNALVVVYLNIDALTVGLEQFFFSPFTISLEVSVKIGVVLLLIVANIIFKKIKRRKNNET